MIFPSKKNPWLFQAVDTLLGVTEYKDLQQFFHEYWKMTESRPFCREICHVCCTGSESPCIYNVKLIWNFNANGIKLQNFKYVSSLNFNLLHDFTISFGSCYMEWWGTCSRMYFIININRRCSHQFSILQHNAFFFRTCFITVNI